MANNSERYHLAANGLPAICVAKPGKCPKGKAVPHFNNKADAIKAAQKKLTEENNPLASHKKEIFHISANGFVEVCQDSSECNIKAFGRFNNLHSANHDVVRGAAKAFREANQSNTQNPSSHITSNLGGTAVQSANNQPNSRTPRVEKPGDIIQVMNPRLGRSGSSSPRTIREAVRQGYELSDIRVLTIDSCHHSSWNPTMNDVWL